MAISSKRRYTLELILYAADSIVPGLGGRDRTLVLERETASQGIISYEVLKVWLRSLGLVTTIKPFEIRAVRRNSYPLRGNLRQ
jgi:hypothetical protein